MLAVSALLVALVAAGCGRNDFQNDPRPPVPAEVSVRIAQDGVGVSPKEFGAGLVNFTIANLTQGTGTLAITGPVDTNSNELPPGAAETLKVDMKTGSYEASVDGIGVKPFSFTVGPERASGQNDLNLP